MTIAARLILPALIFSSLFSFAYANHTWGPYHWARNANPFTIKLGDSLTSSWDPYLKTAAADWSASSVMDVVVVPSGKNAKTCRAVTGRGEVCNAKYGSNGWLGIAQIFVSGEHITAGTVRMNDTYFSKSAYNKAEWKNLVMCQEVGHIFGLAHQDENMTNPDLGSCMDYTNNPASNQHPNAHDYDMLEIVYAHLDTTTTLGQASASKAQDVADYGDPREWGKELRRSGDGRVALFARDLGGGQQVFTHVFWASEDEGSRFSRGAAEETH